MTPFEIVTLGALGWLVARIEGLARLLHGHLRDHSKGTPLSSAPAPRQ